MYTFMFFILLYPLTKKKKKKRKKEKNNFYMNFLFVIICLIVKLTRYFIHFYSVYEETAGLTVNDPVLRTRKVFCYTGFSLWIKH